MFLRKLAVSNFLARKARTALTVAAVALSVSLVVAVTSGYESVRAAVRRFMDQYLGATDAQISRQNDPRGPITEKVVAALRADPDVRRVDGRVEAEAGVLDRNGEAVEGRVVQVFGVVPGGDPRLAAMTMEHGAFFTADDGDVAVVDQALAERLLEERKKEVDTPPAGTPPAPPKPDDPQKPKRPITEAIGTTVTLPGPRKVTLTIVGIVRKPDILAQTQQSMYVPLRTLQRFEGWDASYRPAAADAQPGAPTPPDTSGPQVNRVMVELNKGVNPRAFEKRWKEQLAKIDPNLKFKLTRDTRDELDKNMASIDLLSYLGGTVSMLAATFIVFSSLSMGVSERQRTLAMLRAVGAFRSQVGMLVVIEGLALATAGVVIGVPLGWLWVKLLTLKFPDLFSAGVVVHWGGVLFGSVGSILTALAAGLLPAWWATRVSPLEAMAPEAAPPSGRAPYKAALVGLLLIAIDPFLFFGPVERIAAGIGASDPKAVAGWFQFYGHFGLGLPGIMIGFFLVAPLLVYLVETAFGLVIRLQGLAAPARLRGTVWRPLLLLAGAVVLGAVAVVFFFGFRDYTNAFGLRNEARLWFLAAGLAASAVLAAMWLLAWLLGNGATIARQQLSTGLWRAAGTAAALMVGLAVLVVMQVQGHTALEGWRLPTNFPDIFVVSPPGGLLGGTGDAGLGIDQVKTLEGVPGIKKDEILPIAIASPQFGHGMFSFAMAVMNPEATMFFGIDPHRAFKMMQLEFRDGSAASAEQLMADGQGLTLVPNQTVLPPEAFETRKEGEVVSKVKGVTVYQNARSKAVEKIVMQGMVTDEGDHYHIDLTGTGPRDVPKAQVAAAGPGRFLVITNEFRELKGLGVGDDFPLKSAAGPMVHYTVAGVVWSPGIDVIVSVFDMGRQFDQRTAASVFGTLRAAKEDFGVEKVYLFAANLEWNVQREDLLKSLKDRLRIEGMRAGDVRGIKEKIVLAFRRLLLLASSVAFAAMAVASLGVTNTVMAGIRTRRWQFGVLRSIGVTRGQLLRIVLAEAVLLGVVACALGLLAGGVMSVDAHALQVLTTGYNPDLKVPWDTVGLGAGIVLFIALAASLWPAAAVARAEPLALLQAGRAAT